MISRPKILPEFGSNRRNDCESPPDLFLSKCSLGAELKASLTATDLVDRISTRKKISPNGLFRYFLPDFRIRSSYYPPGPSAHNVLENPPPLRFSIKSSGEPPPGRIGRPEIADFASLVRKNKNIRNVHLSKLTSTGNAHAMHPANPSLQDQQKKDTGYRAHSLDTRTVQKGQHTISQ